MVVTRGDRGESLTTTTNHYHSSPPGGLLSRRRKARKVALFLLYRVELLEESIEESISSWKLTHQGEELPEFTLKLVEGVAENLSSINSLISKFSEDWSLDRMPLLDRNIMRIAIYEMLYEEDIPVSVSINEAVEIAKAFSTEDSPKFINGVLGKIAVESAEELKR